MTQREERTMLIDTHCHLYAEDYNEDLPEVLERCRENRIQRVLVIGSGYGETSAKQAVALANRHDELYSTVGLHPHDAHLSSPALLDRYAEMLEREAKCLALGETGLDFFYNRSTPDEQRQNLRAHVSLAKSLHVPLIIHDRDAHEEILSILKEEGAAEIPGVFHCFSADAEFGRKVIDELGFYLALGGIVTFKKATNLHEVAREIPLSHLLLETDGPFLTPVPYRGKRNEPWMIRYVAEAIAKHKDIAVDEVIRETGKNAVDLFGLGLNEA